VNVEKRNKDAFSSFYASAVLPMMVRDVLLNDSVNEEMKMDFGKSSPAELAMRLDAH
jgi:hypothetical protein